MTATTYHEKLLDFGEGAESLAETTLHLSSPQSNPVVCSRQGEFEPYRAATHQAVNRLWPRLGRTSSNLCLRSLAASAALLMPLPYRVPDDSATASLVGSISHLDSFSDATRTEDDVANVPDDEDDERPWRGILVVDLPRKVLFSKQIDISPGKLQRWKPDPIVLPPELEDDDDDE